VYVASSENILLDPCSECFDTNTWQTDDVGVFGSSLSNEYVLIAEHFGLNREEISELSKGAIGTIFGSEEDKERLRGLVWE
jgi:adenosine deaminase